MVNKGTIITKNKLTVGLSAVPVFCVTLTGNRSQLKTEVEVKIYS